MSGDVRASGAQVLTQLDAVGQHHQGHHQGHRDRDRGAGRDRAVRLVPHHGGRRRSARRAAPSTCRWTTPTSWSASSSARRVVFYFAGLLIMAVGRAAGQVVYEVREQFRNHPGIMDYTEKPEYGRVVDICTKDSLRELATPGPAGGADADRGRLRVRLRAARRLPGRRDRGRRADGGVPGQLRRRLGQRQEAGRGRPLTAARAPRRTRRPSSATPSGDPFKDTAGPAINPLIKVMNLVSLLIATSVVKYSHNPGLRTGVALVAVGIIVAAVVISKRRTHQHGRRGSARGGAWPAQAAPPGCRRPRPTARPRAPPPRRRGRRRGRGGNGRENHGLTRSRSLTIPRPSRWPGDPS